MQVALSTCLRITESVIPLSFSFFLKFWQVYGMGCFIQMDLGKRHGQFSPEFDVGCLYSSCGPGDYKLYYKLKKPSYHCRTWISTIKNAFTICITSCCYIVCVFVDTSCSYDSYSIWRGRQRACISGLGWKKSVNLGTALGWRWEGDLGWEVMRENVGAWGTKTSKCGHRELAFLFLPGEMIQLD